MHRDFSLQAGRGSPKIAVLDAVHGARAIAQRMACCGLEADALEVYHHTPSVAGYDLVVAPVHLSPQNPVLAEARSMGKRVITHHQAVGELLEQDLDPGLKVFEVTGTHSKTTTALLLSKMLSAKRSVVSHTTRGIEMWSGGSSSLLRHGLSITPGNAIPAMDEAVSRGADALVLEISLGGTGIADFGVLTSFFGDYMIAGGTKWASTAKLQMVSLAKRGSRLVANTDAKISADVSFGPNGQVRAEPGVIYFGEIGHNGHNGHNSHDSHSIRLSEDLDFPSYQTALAAAAVTARAAGIDVEEIVSSLEGFDGFGGRMKIDRKEGLTIYDCSNSGLKLSDVKRALDNASGGSIGMVVGEEAETVCEGMDVPGLVELLKVRRKEIGRLVLVGKRLEPWAKELEAKTARDLTAGREAAADQSIDRLLLCVKCFR
jgi:UDP-N-acetylmuramyl pentapeptide synthase